MKKRTTALLCALALACAASLMTGPARARATRTQDEATDGRSLAALVAAAGSAQRTIRVVTPQTLAADLTVPPNITLEFGGAGTVSVAAGKTLTIQGPLASPVRKIFVNALPGQGTVSLSGNRSVTEVFAEWWGAVTGDGADDTAAIRAALAALQSRCGSYAFRSPDGYPEGAGCGYLRPLQGDYNVGAGVTSGSVFTYAGPVSILADPGARWVHASLPRTVDILTATLAPPARGATLSLTQRTLIRNLTIIGANPSYVSGRYGINIDMSCAGSGNCQTEGFDISHCMIFAGDAAVFLTNPTNTNGGLYKSRIHDNPMLWNGIVLRRAGDTITVDGNGFSQPYGGNKTIEVDLVPGSTGPFIHHNNITYIPIWYRSGYGGEIAYNIIENTNPAITGHNGAMIDVSGGGTYNVRDLLIHHNTLNSQLGAALDAIRVDAAQNVTVTSNSYILPAGKRAVYATANAVHLVLDPEGETSYGPSGLNYQGDAGADLRYELKSKNAAATTAAQNLGNFRIAGDIYSANLLAQGALSFDGKALNSLGTPANGVMVWCKDCNVVSAPPHTCTPGGSGAWAFRSGGAWRCPF